MKKFILFFVSMLVFMSYAEAQPTKEARKIIDALEGANGRCYTKDGERGTLLPNSSSQTTTSGYSRGTSDTYSRSNSRNNSTSTSASVGITDMGISGSASNSYSSSRSNSSTNSQSTNGGNSTTVNYECIPDSKRW